jgi:hypothetical protein
VGGKGSGRHEKPITKVLDEIADEIFEIDEMIINPEIKRRLGSIIARIDYHIAKLKRQGLHVNV